MPPHSFEANVGEEHEGVRLDVYLAEVIEDASRSFLKNVIKDGRVSVNGGVCARPGRTMTSGDTVEVDLPPPPPIAAIPEDIPLDIVYEDKDLVVVNKPSSMVVHPAPGHYTGTLVNALLHHCPDLRDTGDDPLRPGIVHRIDRFTSGLLVVAKNGVAFLYLGQQAREHRFDRRYLALVAGQPRENAGRVSASVGRSLGDPARMTVTSVNARDAVTRFEVLERFRGASLLGLELETGRTHQIRVHLRFAGYPVLGDPVYGATEFDAWPGVEPVRAALRGLDGQALHAERLGFQHPRTHERLAFTAPPPADFQRALDALREQGGSTAT